MPLIPRRAARSDRCFRLGLFRKARGDQLLRDFLRRAALQRLRGDEAAVLTLGGGAQHDELRVGEFD